MLLYKFNIYFRLSCCPVNLFFSHQASRGLEAACSEKLLGLLSDRAQTLHNDRTFYPKQLYRFCFFYFNGFWPENDNTALIKSQISISMLWQKKYMILKELAEIK